MENMTQVKGQSDRLAGKRLKESGPRTRMLGLTTARETEKMSYFEDCCFYKPGSDFLHYYCY